MVSGESDTSFSSVFGDVAWKVSTSFIPEPTNTEPVPTADNLQLSLANRLIHPVLDIIQRDCINLLFVSSDSFLINKEGEML